MSLIVNDISPYITDGTLTLNLYPIDGWNDSYSINNKEQKIPFQDGSYVIKGTKNGRTIKVSGHIESWDLEVIETFRETFETIVNHETGIDLYFNNGSADADKRYYTGCYLIGSLDVDRNEISRHQAFEFPTWSCTFLATNPDQQIPGGGSSVSDYIIPAGSNLKVHGNIYQYNASNELIRVLRNDGSIRTMYGIEQSLSPIDI